MAEKTSKIKGIERGRATQAYRYVEKAFQDTNIKNDEYKAGVKKLPVLIKTNGLGQALAFIDSRGKTWSQEIYEQIGGWLTHQGVIQTPEKMVKEIIDKNSDEYRQAAIETLALLNWMRRFVDGLDINKKEVAP